MTLYSKFEMKSDGMVLTSPSGKRITLEAFESQPIEITYDDRGGEDVKASGEPEKLVRFFPDEVGIYRYDSGEFEVTRGDLRGYVRVSGDDPRYFAFSDRSSYCPVGMNLAFISPFGKSDGKEFGRSGFRFLGLRQYERWLRACHENGVDLVRIWLGHEYFCPDTEEAGVLDGVQLSKLEAFFELARRYEIRVKLTVEQFRFFDYERVADSDSYSDDVFRKFNKRLRVGKKRCESPAEWLSGEEFRAAWLYKIKELSKRFSGDPALFGIELWNEMNCLPWKETLEWNRIMLPEVKRLFPRQLVMNSLGSFDSKWSLAAYEEFPWELSDIKQMHRYLDQGAAYEVCRESPIELIRDGAEILADGTKPFLVAETGAVNDRHSGPFRYYPADHDGILFCDLVYTPLFVGAAGCGQIWHWDERYVESKNLYRYFRPLKKLICGVDFAREGFVPGVWENEDVIFLYLRGKSVTLGYLRNKSTNWRRILRDLEVEVTVDAEIPLDFGAPEVIKIRESESARVEVCGDGMKVEELLFGLLLRF